MLATLRGATPQGVRPLKGCDPSRGATLKGCDPSRDGLRPAEGRPKAVSADGHGRVICGSYEPSFYLNRLPEAKVI